MTFTLSELNGMSKDKFMASIGWVCEHSPWVVERAWSASPYETLDSLLMALKHEVMTAPREEALRLIRAHPDLATRLEMTEASQQEQSGAGLNQLTAEEFAAFTECNKAYVDKFGFPFILAVRGKWKDEILASMKQRLKNDADTEFAQALQQIVTIVGFRIDDTITSE